MDSTHKATENQIKSQRETAREEQKNYKTTKKQLTKLQ